MGPPTGWHRLRLLREILDELVPGVEQFLLVDNVVAVEDGAALVPGQEHGDPLWDVRADEVARGGVLSSSVGACQTWPMKSDTPSYHGYRFPPEIISHAVWLYHRFGVSFRDVEDLLAQRGITVSYEAIRLWCLTFGSAYARRLKRRQGRLGDIWHLDEVFVIIQGRRHYLWRAVDQDSDVLDILVQSRRDCRAAKRFFRKLLQGQERQPGRLVTDKLSSYKAAHRVVMPSVAHRTDQYANNRAEVSHQPTRQRERQMRRFKSAAHAQRFLSVHGLVLNLFRVGRHLLRSAHHRLLRRRAFAEGIVKLRLAAVFDAQHGGFATG